MLIALTIAAFFGIIQGLNVFIQSPKRYIPTTTNLWDYIVDNKYHQ